MTTKTLGSIFQRGMDLLSEDKEYTFVNGYSIEGLTAEERQHLEETVLYAVYEQLKEFSVESQPK